jgi:hypothetical protein
MKRRFLSYGISASHNTLTPLADFSAPLSISDYDAFIFDPLAFGGHAFQGQVFHRRRKELSDLVQVKGGIIICILNPDQQVNFGIGGITSPYNLLDTVAPQAMNLVRNSVQLGEGSQLKLIQTARGALSAYFRVLRENLRFAAYLNTDDASIVRTGGVLFAVNSVGSPIAIEFSVGAGRLCFVPVPHGIPGDRAGAAFAQVIEAHFGGPTEIELPDWATSVIVPGADSHDARIAELEVRKDQIVDEISELNAKRLSLQNYRTLLFGSGTAVLESVVRDAFRLLGFDVPEPDAYEGEWDIELRDTRSGNTAIGEAEGSEGIIDVDKYRQLLDYYQNEILEGRTHKGILIGNGYRLKPLDSPERQKQFSEHALNGSTANKFCLVPTTELFKAVCTILETPENEGLKIEIRDSIFAAVGIWTFSREVATDSGSKNSADLTRTDSTS